MNKKEKLIFWQQRMSRFFNHSGLYYLLIVAVILLLSTSVIFSFVEGVGFWDAMWWAIETTTTVGYGDIYPHTVLGRIVAVILMFLGIGIIGVLTSTITNWYRASKAHFEKLESIETEIKELREQLSEHEETKQLLQNLVSELRKNKNNDTKKDETD
ncbi:potassium channel protein [Periweissella cryptocerci]|uniref:Potassium channel protein n=1 Tax=Periweissella cryptocerci TaxID=2506420 RepID=A0A4P6YV81_9LACO|nr:ion channel [Periweissella cryptocerci]QBO36692.1 potassium channel protein [Periweissella cryptocerci]